MARVSLDDALRGDDDEPPKRKLGERGPVPPPAEPDTYKLTAVLDEDAYRRLEWLTDRVIDDIQPRRVGKGWRTKVVRALVALAEDDYDMVRKVADEVRRQME